MKLEKKYLVFPSDNNKNTVAVNIRENGEIIEQVFVSLCDPTEREDNFFVDISDLTGKDVTIDIESVPRTEWARLPEGEKEDKAHLDSLAKYVYQSDSYTERIYGEKYRPVYHFTVQRGWMNDPNGCFYKDGIYHLYCQHCPGTTVSYWDNNHWGHAVSTDLVHWRELPPAIRYPHAASGAAFFSKDGKIFSATGPYLLSTEDGSTFKIESVLERDEGGIISGDPKIFYNKKTDLYSAITLRDLGAYQFSTSSDLKKWHVEGEIEGFRECPEFALLKNEKGEEKAVLFGGDGAYAIGSFNGKMFYPDPIPENRHDKYRYVMNEAKDFSDRYNGSYVNDKKEGSWERMVAYAYQIFFGAPGTDPVRIAWITSKTAEHGMPFQSAMSFPQRIKLKNTGVGERICCLPADEIEGLYRETKKGGEKVSFDSGKAFDTKITASIAKRAQFKIGGYTLTYDDTDKKMTFSFPGEPDFDVPYIPLDDKIKIRALVDIGITEFFLGEGEAYIPLRPDNYDFEGISVTAPSGSEIVLSSLSPFFEN